MVNPSIIKKDKADEELRRSKEEGSFPRLLAKQPGLVELELIKINGEKTMSIQTWQTEKDWWTAPETVRKINENLPAGGTRENILVSCDFFNRYIQVHLQV